MFRDDVYLDKNKKKTISNPDNTNEKCCVYPVVAKKEMLIHGKKIKKNSILFWCDDEKTYSDDDNFFIFAETTYFCNCKIKNVFLKPQTTKEELIVFNSRMENVDSKGGVDGQICSSEIYGTRIEAYDIKIFDCLIKNCCFSGRLILVSKIKGKKWIDVCGINVFNLDIMANEPIKIKTNFPKNIPELENIYISNQRDIAYAEQTALKTNKNFDCKIVYVNRKTFVWTKGLPSFVYGKSFSEIFENIAHILQIENNTSGKERMLTEAILSGSFIEEEASNSSDYLETCANFLALLFNLFDGSILVGQDKDTMSMFNSLRFDILNKKATGLIAKVKCKKDINSDNLVKFPV